MMLILNKRFKNNPINKSLNKDLTNRKICSIIVRREFKWYKTMMYKMIVYISPVYTLFVPPLI